MLGMFWISVIVSLFFPPMWIVTGILLLVVMCSRKGDAVPRKPIEYKEHDDSSGLAIVLAIASLLFLVANMAHANQVVTVQDNLGGNIADYVKQAKEWKRDKVQVRLSGKCASACTIYVMRRFRLDVCAMPETTLRFHMPYYGKSYSTEKQDWDFFVGDSEHIELSAFEWRTKWLGRFNDKLNIDLYRATLKGKIPNPSIDGNYSDKNMYIVNATDFIKPCSE